MASDPTGSRSATREDDSGRLAVTRVRPAYQQVADQLRELILSGSLLSGDRLPPEADLAANFGVSRSTVREALRVLASRDLIRTIRGTTGGTFVSSVRHEQVSDYLETSIGLMSGSDSVSVSEMLEARELLEVPSARMAAERLDDDHLVAMREALERETVRRGRQFREDRNFHALIVDAAGNRLLSTMTEPLFRVLQAKYLSPDLSQSYWKQVDRDHERIVAAIADGDGDAAATAMHEHLVRLREAYTD